MFSDCSPNSSAERTVGQSQGYIEDYEQTEREHRGIVDAMKAGDFERAVVLLRAHFARGESEVLGAGDRASGASEPVRTAGR